MAIKNIGTNKYQISIELGNDIYGKRKRKYVTFKGDKKDAIAKQAELIKDYYHLGNNSNLSNITFEDYSKVYIEKYCVPNIALITLHEYKRLLIKINSIIGKVKLSAITPLLLDDMFLMLKTGDDGRKTTYNYQYNYYKLLRAMLNKAVNWELIVRNPVDKMSNKPKNDHKEKRFYDNQQVKQLLTILENESVRNQALIRLALDSGFRRSELVGLKWNDIDLENGIIDLKRSLKYVEKVVDEKGMKTYSSVRKIYISNSTIETLKKYKVWQDEYKNRMKEKWIEEDRIFTSRNGTYMTPNNCSKIVRRIVIKYGLDPICLHELRHTSASMLINSGIDAKTVSNRMGHSNVGTTMNIYTHSFDSSKKQCANKLDEILN